MLAEACCSTYPYVCVEEPVDGAVLWTCPTCGGLGKMLVRPIPGHPGYYAADAGVVVSTLGRGMHGLKIVRPKVLRPWVAHRHGYLKVQLTGRKREWLHRVICTTWHGPPLPGQEVLHRNDDPKDNRPSELFWGTHQENEAMKRRRRLSVVDIFAPREPLPDPSGDDLCYEPDMALGF